MKKWNGKALGSCYLPYQPNRLQIRVQGGRGKYTEFPSVKEEHGHAFFFFFLKKMGDGGCEITTVFGFPSIYLKEQYGNST